MVFFAKKCLVKKYTTKEKIGQLYKRIAEKAKSDANFAIFLSKIKNNLVLPIKGSESLGYFYIFNFYILYHIFLLDGIFCKKMFDLFIYIYYN